ncbi:pilus assembly PilX N-terminal domain-containing protein [uncultured Clostridium sp.]|uniref:pilus assembly PilX N-terminal domain-containing protein n=1 Tax=uncultured Clostridium sp. TaxID=59620 RepID=UPI00260C3B9D|nr:pilus assembly PilX N-terminal domain-containing protein [uncultured Clostridium sp.]
MRKKKRGSTMLTVLAIGMIFMTLSGIMLTVIMGTMKSNTNQKNREDLKYAAESGIEIARSYFKLGNTTIDTRTDIEEKELTKILIRDNVEKVDVFLEEENGESIVKSIAYCGNGKETVKVKYTKSISGNTTNIFEHGLVSGSGGITITNGGTIDTSTSSISTPSGKVTATDGKVTGEIKSNDIKRIEFKNWKTPEKKITYKDNGKFYIDEKEVPVMEVKGSMNRAFINPEWSKPNLTIVGSNKTLEEYFKDGKEESIIKVEVAGTKVGYKVDVILVNSENLEIETSRQLTNSIIINNGKIIVGGKGNFALNSSTILANEIAINNEGTLHVTNQPLKKDYNSHGIIDEDEVSELNRLLSVFISNWNNSNNENEETGIELIEGSFSN